MALDVFADGLLHNGCVAQFFGGAKTRASCGNGMLRTGVFFFFAGVAWWALHGVLLLIPTEVGWRGLASIAKYAGGTAGALVGLLYVLPVVVVFFLYIVYPIVLLVVAGVVFLGAWIFGNMLA